MELSKRLSAVAGLVTEGASVADIGTDHGYIPIWLAKRVPAVKLIAMDVNEGPLERAREHILAEGLSDRIDLRLSDGFSALDPGEVHTIIAAGMGGGLVIHILEANPAVTDSVQEFILQPQSEIERVRAYLEREGYTIVREEMVEEDGKYYPMMKAVHRREIIPYSEVELLYGSEIFSCGRSVSGRTSWRGCAGRERRGLSRGRKMWKESWPGFGRLWADTPASKAGKGGVDNALQRGNGYTGGELPGRLCAGLGQCRASCRER